ncbi:DUF748 domain-containing protein [Thalassotalea sediminis]|uniref:DUF748 domain-containing protein n=1 Tax=Thalassotalea sediminis TaxID=1759089 RepID=UPI002572F0FF|nr:DUF748 domain-containing protein [Thalassotalea sediminis]
MFKKYKIVFLSATAVAVFFAYITLGTSGLVSYFINKNLPSTALSANIESVRLNPFTLSVNVKGLTLAHQEKKFLQLNEISVDLHWWHLLQGNLTLEYGEINGGSLSAEWSDNGLSFAGWQPTTQTATPSDNSEPSESSVLLNKLVLTKFNVDLTAKTVHQLKLAELSLSNTLLNAKGMIGEVALQSMLNDKELRLASSFKKTDQTLSLSISDFIAGADINTLQEWLPNEFKSTEGSVTTELAGDIELKDNKWYIDLEKSLTKVKELSLPLLINEQLTLAKVADMQLSADGSSIVWNADAEKLEGLLMNNFAMESVLWQQIENNDVILSLDTFNLKNGRTKFNDNIEVTIANLLLAGGKVSQKSTIPQTLSSNIVELKPLLTFQQIEVSDISFDQKLLTVGSFVGKLDKLSIYKSKDNPLENLVLVKAKEETNAASETQQNTVANEVPKVEQSNADKPVEQAIGVVINRVQISGNPHLVLHDFTASEPVIQDIMIETLNIDNISSHVDAKPAQFELLGHLGKRSTVAVKGEITPFEPGKILKAKGELKTVNLTQFSPYIVDAIGHKIKQGQLNANIEFSVNSNAISGKVTTDIKAIALSPHIGKKQKVTSNHLVPLNVAISQLTDKKGNLTIDIPLTGRFDDPDFGLSGFISLITTKALKEGAKSYLMQTFVPYSNIVTVAMMAGDTLFAINVDDLNYSAKQIDMKNKQTAFADQIANILTDKKELQITVCPIVGVADFPAGSRKKALTNQQANQASVLGQQRLATFVDYLVEEKQVAHDRVVPCATEIDHGSALGKLAFTLK